MALIFIHLKHTLITSIIHKSAFNRAGCTINKLRNSSQLPSVVQVIKCKIKSEKSGFILVKRYVLAALGIFESLLNYSSQHENIPQNYKTVKVTKIHLTALFM